jgi:hypothetical protein
MRRTRGLLVLAVVSWGAACTFTEPLNGLTGGGGAADAASDVAEDTTTGGDANGGDTGGAGEAGDTGGADGGGTQMDASGDVAAPVDASDGGSSGDVVQPDVVTGPVSCATAGVFLCEDFESGGLDTNKWPEVTTNYATSVVDGTQHHRGSYALHVHMPALTTDGGSVSVGSDIRHIATVPSQIFVRAFVSFSSLPPQSTEQFFLAQQSGAPYDGLQLEIDQQTNDYSLTDWSVSPTYYAVGTVGATAGTWSCVEWELEPPASGMTMTTSDVWIDGNEVPSLHLTNTPMTDLEVLGFGIGFYQVTSLPSYDVWIDDIYVDTSPVGCDK